MGCNRNQLLSHTVLPGSYAVLFRMSLLLLLTHQLQGAPEDEIERLLILLERLLIRYSLSLSLKV